MADLMQRLKAATHAYIGIVDGKCRAVCVDTGDKDTAQFVAKLIRRGASVERVTIEVARGALFKPWPHPPQEAADG